MKLKSCGSFGTAFFTIVSDASDWVLVNVQVTLAPATKLMMAPWTRSTLPPCVQVMPVSSSREG